MSHPFGMLPLRYNYLKFKTISEYNGIAIQAVGRGEGYVGADKRGTRGWCFYIVNHQSGRIRLSSPEPSIPNFI